MDKLITFAVPCYNSAAYMDHCVQTLLTAGEDTLTLKKGASVFLPAGLGAYTLDGTGQAILTTV